MSAAPDGWVTKPLSELADINPPKPKYAGLETDAAVGFIPMAAVDEGTGTADVEVRRLGELRAKSYRTFASGDVLFAKITPCMENGKCAVVPEMPNSQGFGSTEFHVLRAKPGVDARYLWRFLRQASYRTEAEAHMTGSVGQMRVPADFLRETMVTIPVGEEAQRQVVHRLTDVDGRASSARSHVKRGERALSDFRRSLLASACSGRLSEDVRAAEDASDDAWVDGYMRPGTKATARAEQKNGGLTAESQIDLLPASWRLVRLGDVFDVATGATPLRKNPAYYDGGSIPWVTSGAVNAGLITEANELITELAIAETNAKVFPEGTLLVAMYGEGQTRGRVGELAIEAATNQAVAAVLFDERNSALRDYLRIFFEDSYQRIRALAFGGVQMNLSLGVIKNTLVPLPPPNERDEIVRRVHQGLAVYEEAGRRLAITSRRIERATDLAVAAVFSGDSSSPLVGEREVTGAS